MWPRHRQRLRAPRVSKGRFLFFFLFLSFFLILLLSFLSFFFLLSHLFPYLSLFILSFSHHDANVLAAAVFSLSLRLMLLLRHIFFTLLFIFDTCCSLRMSLYFLRGGWGWCCSITRALVCRRGRKCMAATRARGPGSSSFGSGFGLRAALRVGGGWEGKEGEKV